MQDLSEYKYMIHKAKEKEKWKAESDKKAYRFIKRLMDIVLSLISLICLSPLFLIIAILIKRDSKGTVLYSQTRIGIWGKPFKMYKFRSMCMDADRQLDQLAALNERDGPVFKISNDPRVTKVGSFIRKTCIDELPQLINILKGDMSIVGPRPPLPNEVDQYTPYQMKRLNVRPGLTCYWQIKKGEQTTFEEWVDMDLKYIRERSSWVDIKIIFLTMRVVLCGKGSL